MEVRSAGEFMRVPLAGVMGKPWRHPAELEDMQTWEARAWQPAAQPLDITNRVGWASKSDYDDARRQESR